MLRHLPEQQVSNSGHSGWQCLAGHQHVALVLGHCFSSPAVECLQDKVRGERSNEPQGEETRGHNVF